jgi:hypothetical protein
MNCPYCEKRTLMLFPSGVCPTCNALGYKIEPVKVEVKRAPRKNLLSKEQLKENLRLRKKKQYQKNKKHLKARRDAMKKTTGAVK